MAPKITAEKPERNSCAKKYGAEKNKTALRRKVFERRLSPFSMPAGRGQKSADSVFATVAGKRVFVERELKSTQGRRILCDYLPRAGRASPDSGLKIPKPRGGELQGFDVEHHAELSMNTMEIG